MFTGKDFRLAVSASDTRSRPLARPDVYAHCGKLKTAESLKVTLRSSTSFGAWALHFREPRVSQTHTKCVSYRTRGHLELGTQCCAAPRLPQHPPIPVSCLVQPPATWLSRSPASCLGSPQGLHPEGGKVSPECQRTLL